MKKLTDNTYGIVVPDNQTVNSNYEIVRSQDNFKMRQLHYPESVWNGYQEYGCTDIGEYDCVILGFVTIDKIDFDPTDMVERDKYVTHCFKDYTGTMWPFSNPKGSLWSLLAKEGLYWVNPYGENEPEIKYYLGSMGILAESNRMKREKWQQAESQKLSPNQKIIIIQKL